MLGPLAVHFLWRFLWVSPGGRYPPRCPTESRLSSIRLVTEPRSPGRLIPEFIQSSVHIKARYADPVTLDDAFAAISRATERDRLLIAAVRGGQVRDGGGQLDAFLDLARALSAASIPYALIGGVAVGIRSGVPRATKDVDVAAASQTTRDSLKAALAGAGFEATGDFEHRTNFRHRNGEPIQVAFDPAFDDAIARAESIRVQDVPIRIVLIEDLIAMKERAARDPARRPSKALRDAADVALLRGDTPEPNEGW